MFVSALAFVIYDYRGFLPSSLKDKSNNAVIVLTKIASWPHRYINNLRFSWYKHKSLVDKYHAMEDKNIILNSIVANYDAVVKENSKLRKILQLPEVASNKAIVAEVMLINEIAPERDTIMVNAGINKQVSAGDVVISTEGIVGMVQEVYGSSSKIRLITDNGFSLPVQETNDGNKTIAIGSSEGVLKLLYLVSDSKFKVGQKVVTSGVGGKYKPGYQVGKVENIIPNAQTDFIDVIVQPSVNFSNLTQVVIVKNEERT